MDWLQRWAHGPGRDSHLWFFCTLAILALPFTAALAPDCGESCETIRNRAYFVPNILFVPLILVATTLVGSWWAQRHHRKVEEEHYDRMGIQLDLDAPPGSQRPAELDAALRRTSRIGLASGAMVGAAVLAGLGATSLGMRRCDGSRTGFLPSTMPRCKGALDWVDLVIAIELWPFCLLGVALAVWLATGGKVPRIRLRRVAALK